MKAKPAVYRLLGGLLWLAPVAHADEVILEPIRDNTLYEDDLGSISNGAGAHFFAGQTFAGDPRRGLLVFDIVGNLTGGAKIDSVTLTLHMSKTISGETTTTLHRVLADWGESSSDAPSEEGEGANAEIGDATWLHTFYDTDFWTAPGGDFDSKDSASQNVSGIGYYTWGSSTGMVADVQSWLDDPSTNFGWVLLGDEEGAAPTAKRFDSRENETIEYRPRLAVEFTPQVPAVSEWGLMVMALLGLTGGTLMFRRTPRKAR